MTTFDDNMTGTTGRGLVTASHSMPAGVLSFVLHLAAFSLLAFFVQPARPVLRDEPERAVQIVMVRDDFPSHNQYAVRSNSMGREAVRATDTSSPAASVPSDIVPTFDQVTQLIPRELTLPTSDTSTNAAGTLPTQRLTASHGSGGRIPIAGDSAFISAEQSRLRANPPTGSPATVRLFGGPTADGRIFIFLIDRSKSMEHAGLRALEVAEAELQLAVQPLEPNHKFQVIAYHHECLYLSRRELLPATDDNKQILRGFLSSLAAYGATDHEMALQSALRHQPDVIYLLTDGGDPEMSEAQLRKITKLAGARTSIHCIQFGFGPQQSEDSFLRRLAAMNRGGYEYIDISRNR